MCCVLAIWKLLWEISSGTWKIYVSDSATLTTMQLSLASEQAVKVVMSGTGGDELFDGYPWRYAAAIGNSRR